MSVLRYALCVVLLAAVEAYPSGAPQSACATMIPGHDPNVPQTDAAPYDLHVVRDGNLFTG